MSTPLSPTLQLACDLIARASVTPEDQGCQPLIAERLKACGFQVQSLSWNGVDNLWAVRGTQGPMLCLAGHTDVVPPGPLEDWKHPPFNPVIDTDGLLYGRGSADMKGSLAAMVVAVERFIAQCPEHKGQIAFLITSDEEGPAEYGTQAVVEHLRQQGQRMEWCIVGEPSSTERLGDMVKNGRRGSLNGQLMVQGKQGHVAYPQRARNPIHLAAPALAELAAEIWDEGNAFFPPTSFQISNIQAGTGTTNVIPGSLKVLFNFRFSTESSVDSLKQRVTAILNRHGLEWSIDWSLSGLPFLTEPGALLAAITTSIREVTGLETELSTSGGTSDGRFIATLGTQVVEVGPVNASIHQVNEHVRASDLDKLTDIYQQTLQHLLG